MRKIFPFKRKRRKAGQSMVEFAIFLPILLMLLTGVVEFGFMLNQYVSLVHGTRQAARYYSVFTPFNTDGSDNPDFYNGAISELQNSILPLKLDENADDVVVTVFSISDNGTFERFPKPGGMGGGWHWRNNDASRFTNEMLKSRLTAGAPPTGALLVEVFYDYHHLLGLPWLTAFVPNPTTLYAYTFMPLSAAEPTPAPSSFLPGNFPANFLLSFDLGGSK
jgi:hypothetical protein